MINYKNLFASVSKGKQDEPVLLMSREDIINTENGSELLLMQGTVLLTWKEGITDEEKKYQIYVRTLFYSSKRRIICGYPKEPERNNR